MHQPGFLSARDVELWIADEAGRPVLCGISHEALRDQANRAHFEGTNDGRFEVYQELLEQMASDAFDADASDQAGCVLRPCTHKGIS